jgi:ABC-type protease/lipase transport system fused ATPase/permease subunit
LRRFQETGTSILVASHSPPVLQIATKVMWLKWGRVKSYGMRESVLSALGLRAVA